MDFMANGDTAPTGQTAAFRRDFYGFRFAEARLSFPTTTTTKSRCKILLDTPRLRSPRADARSRGNALFYAVSEDYEHIRSKAKRYKEVRENPHFNAVQVKFALCRHGPSWRRRVGAVFIDPNP